MYLFSHMKHILHTWNLLLCTIWGRLKIFVKVAMRVAPSCSTLCNVLFIILINKSLVQLAVHRAKSLARKV